MPDERREPDREPERELAIVVYGATGFVGRLTAEYLAGIGSGLRIGLAGRSVERLRAVRQGLGPDAQDWPLITADAAEPAALDAMAARTRVVISTVGPYTRYGLPLVGACAAAGTDYVDVAGETMFIRHSIDAHHKQAADNGCRIVHSCGFDSIPSDLSAYALYRRASDDGAGELIDTDFVLRGASGGASGGTVASIIEFLRTASADPDARRLLHDPYTLSGDRGAEPEVGPQPDLSWRRGAEIAPELAGLWTAGFAMAPANTRVVRRSNALLDWAYGRRFRYAEHMSVGSSPAAPLLAGSVTAAGSAVLSLGSRYFRLLPDRLIQRLAPAAGTGPSVATRQRGYYRVETYTRTAGGERYRATMAQQGDPGYQATSVLLGECAVALIADRDKLSGLHGVLTPAAAMGEALLSRLPAAGVTIQVDSLS